MPNNTRPQLLDTSRFSREQEQRDRDAALRSLDDTTLRPALRYSDPDDTTEWPRRAAYSPSPSWQYPQPKRHRRGVGVGAIVTIAAGFGLVIALVLHATSPRVSSVGIFGAHPAEQNTVAEAPKQTNEPQVTATAPAQEPVVSEPEPTYEEPVAVETTETETIEPEAVSEPETYTFTWTDDGGNGHGREEHTLTYTYDNGSYTIEYDGYSFTVTDEELEWLLGEGWDEGWDQGFGEGWDQGWDQGFGFEPGPGGQRGGW